MKRMVMMGHLENAFAGHWWLWQAGSQPELKAIKPSCSSMPIPVIYKLDRPAQHPTTFAAAFEINMQQGSPFHVTQPNTLSLAFRFYVSTKYASFSAVDSVHRCPKAVLT